MVETAFARIEFWALILSSLVLPAAIYFGLWMRRAVSPPVVAGFGMLMVLLAGFDIFLLQVLSSIARVTPSMADDKVFASEISAALYLMPALVGGVGVNLVSHVLVRHLFAAERNYEKQRSA